MAMPSVQRRGLAWDPGRELTLREDLSLANGRACTSPHAPLQRGTKEKIADSSATASPRHIDLARHTAADLERVDLERVALELNQRPRLALDDVNPEHVLAL